MDINIVHRIIKGYGIPTYTRPPVKAVEERPVCTQSELCVGCPYPTHGFICWSKDGDCIRTRMERLQKK